MESKTKEINLLNKLLEESSQTIASPKDLSDEKKLLGILNIM